jgi:uncharacterized damage-inducible protein DinB
MMRHFRPGAKGALLDEYERAISDLKKVVSTLQDSSLSVIRDSQTSDDNCRTIQTVLSHVISAGYGYAISIHNIKGGTSMRPNKTFHGSIKEYLADLNNLLAFTETVLMDITDNELEQCDNSLKIKSSWGQSYDIEQLMEHAIVHILRHRRQIERFDSL